MVVNEIITVIIAIAIGYLLGSIPSAYIAVRLITGKDIRQVGGGNVGTRNASQQAGRGAGIAVGIFDVIKGAAAVAIAPPTALRAPPIATNTGGHILTSLQRLLSSGTQFLK